jgi:hypothetical protein
MHQIPEITNSIDLFGFVKALLTNKKLYASFTNKVKTDNFFMTQRMLAKGYPIQINAANKNGINQIAILDAYHIKLCADGTNPPSWLYAKAGKDDKSKTKEQILYADIIANAYAYELLITEFGIEHKSLYELINEEYTYVLSEFNSIKNAINGKIK